MRDELLASHGELSLTLSVDFRDSDTPGIHYSGDVVDLLNAKRWRRAFLWPSCTHQVRSDTTTLRQKMRDGRTFWGLVFLLRCWCADADCVVLKQPNTILSEFLVLPPPTRVRPCAFGDSSRKPLNLFVRDTHTPYSPDAQALAATAALGCLASFADADGRDRHRSSWARYPRMCAALAWQLLPLDPPPPAPDFSNLIQAFALQWHLAGLPVPAGYDSPRGQPISAADRLYQRQHGAGDGRLTQAVTPALAPSQLATNDARLFAHAADAAVPLLSFISLVADGLVLCVVAMLVQPLVLAHANGFTVFGANLRVAHSRASALKVAKHWLAALGAAPSFEPFLVGEYAGGPRLAVAPYPHAVARDTVARTPAQRRRLLARGATFIWCTLVALSGAVSHPSFARATLAAECLVRPVPNMPDFDAPHGAAFTFGALRASCLASHLHLPARAARAAASVVAAADNNAAARLRAALLADTSPSAPDFALWAERILPTDVPELPASLLADLPSFDSPALASAPFTQIRRPLTTQYLSRALRQPSRLDRCPKSATHLLLPSARIKLDAWMQSTLADLVAIRDGGASAQRVRPYPLAIGQSEMHEWARGVVWDFTYERNTSCGVPLDFHTPLQTHLNVPFLQTALADYPDQRLLSYLVEGVRLEADVELQTVLVPHLASLPPEYASVRKEIRRLHSKRWYEFFGAAPFWPLYCNGQGAMPRKLEPDRWRRTTEGGGPRRPTFDASGVEALSINAASRVYHLPRHLADDARPELVAWLRAKGFPRDAEQRASDSKRPSKWPREVKPTLSSAMRDSAILNAAGAALGEAVCVFGDDAADSFTQLAMAPEDWWKLKIVFIQDEEHLRTAADTSDAAGNTLFFVSERRLGFGTHPASNIAKRFSDALFSIVRDRMDAADARPLATDKQPCYLAWREARSRIRHADEPRAELAQQRLFFAHMYTDDPVIGVVGVDWALRALRVWRSLTDDVNLLMAIPEKRTLGVWTRWLGALLFASLGVVVIPNAKLVRAAALMRAALAGHLDFAAYRSLVGMLEHFRCVNCRPPLGLQASTRRASALLSAAISPPPSR